MTWWNLKLHDKLVLTLTYLAQVCMVDGLLHDLHLAAHLYVYLTPRLYHLNLFYRLILGSTWGSLKGTYFIYLSMWMMWITCYTIKDLKETLNELVSNLQFYIFSPVASCLSTWLQTAEQVILPQDKLAKHRDLSYGYEHPGQFNLVSVFLFIIYLRKSWAMILN